MDRKVVAIVGSSDGKRDYSVSVVTTHVGGVKRDEWQCACKGWTTHTPRKDCKHITATKKYMENPAAYARPSNIGNLKLTNDGHTYLKVLSARKTLVAAGKIQPEPPPEPPPPVKPQMVREGRPKRFGR